MASRSSLTIVCLVANVLMSIGPAGAAGPADRLERFRTIAVTRLATAQLVDDAASDETYRELYRFVDEEIVESLGSGGVFASLGFLQDHLEAFTEAWGATVVRLRRVGPLTVGAFQLSEGSAGNTVRVYGPWRGEPALLATFSRAGRPVVYDLPAAAGHAQFLVVWEDVPSAHGARPLRLDVVRQYSDGLRVEWSSTSGFPNGLVVNRWDVRGGEVRLHYEVRYPGWTPGCAGQTQQEDVYRLAPAEPSLVRVARHQVNAWHREFRMSVARFFSALSSDDRGALSSLVPDAALRTRLPRSLRAEPACDTADGHGPERVSVAASAERGPWQLTWERQGTHWRVIDATAIGRE